MRHANRKRQGKGRHADCSLSKMKKDEQAVQDISSCLSEFKCDPFDHTNQTLRSLQSGIPASDALAADLDSRFDSWLHHFRLARCNPGQVVHKHTTAVIRQYNLVPA